ncbi:FAE1/Type III polyketide synthase-like protein [Macleaya cordata]|uniref:3-ketoacyl-CoA synthase n=1 Tax=Macleaya cordata TaxID=56857 RepID=A0A200PWQ7_MACCD|nr:FAE1/Type III polyketide synthase-like protein [Macleaya cordata]
MLIMESSLLSLAQNQNPTQILFSLFSNLHLLAATIFILILAKFLYYYSSRSNRVYLIDFACYRPPSNLRAPCSSIVEHYELYDYIFDRESIEFQTKVLLRSGIGSEACLPSVIQNLPPDVTLLYSLEETESILFTVVEDLFVKANINNPRIIDILIVNCSLFCPTPSISSMIINKFRFRSNVISYNLSGMGCSASLVSVSLAKDLLKVHKNSLALILSIECLSNCGYVGRNKSMLLSNTLFRMGGAAILLSNKSQDRKNAKYSLQHLIRTTMGDDKSYRSVVQELDEDGNVGVSLSREILHVAANALRTNITRLGPLVLPYSEQFKFGFSYVWRKIWAPARRKSFYVPDFKKAFEHFCIHAGGRSVIDAVEDTLGLCEEDGEPSRMTLHRFGNTSSSSIWYELCYIEAKGRMKRGDRVWQIAFGSGFKCNSAAWKCISDIDPTVKNAWSDRIHVYPLDVPEVRDH